MNRIYLKILYFYKPNTENECRHPKSFNPFNFGPRNCMGQSLAKLDAKVILSRILTVIDYTICPSLLSNSSMSFNFFSQFKLMGTIKAPSP